MPDLTPDIERELEALDDALAGRRVAPDLTELGELALLLRDDRPQPSEGFGRFLDTRAERGFPARTRASARRRGRRWTALFSLPVLGTAATLLLIAVIARLRAAGRQDDSGGGGSSATTAEAPQADGAGGGDAESSARAAQDEAAPAAPPATGDQEFAEPIPPVAPAPATARRARTAARRARSSARRR